MVPRQDPINGAVLDVTVQAPVQTYFARLFGTSTIQGSRAARAECGDKLVHVAVFDTAFFADLPRCAAEYALPAYLGVDHGVRRYGFHGLAHEANGRGPGTQASRWHWPRW